MGHECKYITAHTMLLCVATETAADASISTGMDRGAPGTIPRTTDHL